MAKIEDNNAEENPFMFRTNELALNDCSTARSTEADHQKKNSKLLDVVDL